MQGRQLTQGEAMTQTPSMVLGAPPTMPPATEASGNGSKQLDELNSHNFSHNSQNGLSLALARMAPGWCCLWSL